MTLPSGIQKLKKTNLLVKLFDLKMRLKNYFQRLKNTIKLEKKIVVRSLI